jgi:hypothetical protein
VAAAFRVIPVRGRERDLPAPFPLCVHFMNKLDSAALVLARAVKQVLWLASPLLFCAARARALTKINLLRNLVSTPDEGFLYGFDAA